MSIFGLELAFPPLTGQVIGAALMIFALRVTGVAISTVRVLIMLRGAKLSAAALGFLEILVYVFAIGQVVNNLSNVWNVLGYCLGFSAGTLIGMWLDEHFSSGYAIVRIVSRYQVNHVADAIRDAGYGATINWGYGRDGSVGMVQATVRRKEAPEVCRLAEAADSTAFVTVEEARSVRRGYMHLAQREK